VNDESTFKIMEAEAATKRAQQVTHTFIAFFTVLAFLPATALVWTAAIRFIW